MRRSRSNYAVHCLAVGILLASGGCQTPAPSWTAGPKSAPSNDEGEVGRVVTFFNPPIFKSFDPEGDPNPEGFGCVLYLVSRKTGKGILADGLLRVSMYRIDPTPEGHVSRQLAHEWVVPTSSLPRSKKPSTLGWGYAPQFDWGDADVLGHEIEIVFNFEPPVGRASRSQTTHLRVPGRKM